MANKLGVAYNIFDGEELLPYSLKGIREIADYVVVVYQLTSNYGKINPNLYDVLYGNTKSGLIDEMVYYEPELIMDGDKIYKGMGSINELRKRNIGLTKCKENGCTLFMSIDCDEVYDPTQLKDAYKEMIGGKYDATFCQMKTYYNQPTLELTPPEGYYVPLFYKLKADTILQANHSNSSYSFPFMVDGTRQTPIETYMVFPRSQIEMYHYAYVRNNIRSKIENSSARTDKIMSEAVIHYFENFQKGKPAIMIGLQRYELKEVPNQFEIQI